MPLYSPTSMYRALPARQGLLDEPQEDEIPKSLVRRASDSALGGLSAVGNFLDTPGSMFRDLLTWMPGGISARNPFDQLLSPFSPKNRTTGEELLTSAGLYSEKKPKGILPNVGRFAGSIGTEILLDPLTYLTFGLSSASKAGKLLSKAGMVDDVAKAGTRKLGSEVGKREAALSTTLRDVMDFSRQTDPAKAAASRGISETILQNANRGEKLTDDLLDNPIAKGAMRWRLPGGLIDVGVGGEKTARALEKASEAVRFGQYSPVRMLAPAFSKAVKGAVTPEAQKAAIESSRYIEESKNLAREEMYQSIKELHESKLLDGSGDDVFERSNRMREYLEDVGRQSVDEVDEKTGDFLGRNFTESDEAFAARPEFDEIRNVLPTLDNLKQSMKEVASFADEEGVKLGRLNDPYATYFPRLFQTTAGPFRMARDRRVLDAGDQFSIGRREYLTDIPGGTAVVQRMSVNPKYAGVFDRKLIGSKKIAKSERDSLFKEFVGEYGLMSGPGENLENQMTLYRELFDSITQRPRSDVDARVPMFAINPAETSLKRLESAGMARAQARGIRELVKATARRIDNPERQRLERDAYLAFGKSESLSNHLSVADRFAEQWSKTTGKPVEEFYGGITTPVPGDSLAPPETMDRIFASAIRERLQDVDAKLAKRSDVLFKSDKDFADALGRFVKEGDSRTGIAGMFAKAKGAIDNFAGRSDPNSLPVEHRAFFEEVAKPGTSFAQSSNLHSTMAGAGFAHETAMARVIEDMGEQASRVRQDLYDEKVAELRAKGLDDDAIAEAKIEVKPSEVLQQFEMPEAVAKDITKMMKPFEGPQVAHEMIGLYDSFLNLFKTHVTATNPGFHVRNFTSGLIQNMLNGVLDPRFGIGMRRFTQPYKDARSLMIGDTVKGAAELPMFGGQRLNDEQATEKLRELVFSHSLLDSPGQHNDLVASLGGSVFEQIPGLNRRTGVVDMVKQSSQPMAGADRWRDVLNPLRVAGGAGSQDVHTLSRYGRSIGNAVEGAHRAGGFIALLRQGYEPAEAARRIKLLHVDYGALSDFERNVMRRTMPFFSFTKGMSKYIASELADRPGGPLAMSIKAANRASDRDNSVPDYVSQGLSVPMGDSPDGSKNFLTGLGLMHEAPLNLLTPDPQQFLFGLASQMTPVLKGPIEAATNESLFQSSPQGGRSLDDQDPLIGRLLSNAGQTAGMLARGDVKGLAIGSEERTQPIRLPKMLELGIANSPAARYLSTARTLMDPRKNVMQKLMGTGTGMRITSVSPGAQDAVLRERASSIIRQHGGKVFERSYIPQEVLDSLDPEEREAAEQWMELMRLLGERAKGRKTAREQKSEPIR